MARRQASPILHEAVVAVGEGNAVIEIGEDLAGEVVLRVKGDVVVIGIVVDGDPFFHAGQYREGAGAGEVRVAPADLFRVVGRKILRLMDEQIDAFDELNDRLMRHDNIAVECETHGAAGVSLEEFVVWNEGHLPAIVLDFETDGGAGMLDVFAGDLRAADGAGFVVDEDEVDLRGEVLALHG